MNHFHNVLSPLAVLTLTGLLTAAPQNPLTQRDPVETGAKAFDAKNYPLALELLSGTAAKGNAKAQRVLGLMNEQGLGTAKDLKAAARFYTSAAEQSDMPAVERLGRLFLGGKGVEKNPAHAVLCFRRGSMLGDPQSMFNLGYCYGTGLGAPRDLVNAGVWYRLAGERGIEQAKDNFEALMPELGETQLTQIDSAARRWQERFEKGLVTEVQLPEVPVAEWLAAERAQASKTKGTKKTQKSPFGDDLVEEADETVVEESEELSVFDLEETDDPNADPFIGHYQGLMVERDENGRTQEFPMDVRFERKNSRAVATVVSKVVIPGPEGKPMNGVITGSFETHGLKGGETKLSFKSTKLQLSVSSIGHTEELPPQELRAEAKGNTLECAMGSDSSPFTSFTMKRVGASEDEIDPEPKRPSVQNFRGTVREMLETGQSLQYDVDVVVRPLQDAKGRSSLQMSGTIEYPTQNGQKIHIEFRSTFEGAFAADDISMSSTKIDVRIRETGQKVPFEKMTLNGRLENGVLKARFGAPATGFSQLEARAVSGVAR